GAELAGVCADGAGRMLALYVTGSGATMDLRSRRHDPAAGLGPEQVCFAGEATPVSFALGDRGDGVVALRVPGGGQNALWAITCLGRTGAWSPAQRLLTGAIEFADGGFVAAAVSPRGTTWLAAVVPQPGNVQELVLFRSGAGGTFGAPLHVDMSEP